MRAKMNLLISNRKEKTVGRNAVVVVRWGDKRIMSWYHGVFRSLGRFSSSFPRR